MQKLRILFSSFFHFDFPKPTFYYLIIIILYSIKIQHFLRLIDSVQSICFNMDKVPHLDISGMLRETNQQDNRNDEIS